MKEILNVLLEMPVRGVLLARKASDAVESSSTSSGVKRWTHLEGEFW